MLWSQCIYQHLHVSNSWVAIFLFFVPNVCLNVYLIRDQWAPSFCLSFSQLVLLSPFPNCSTLFLSSLLYTSLYGTKKKTKAIYIKGTFNMHKKNICTQWKWKKLYTCINGTFDYKVLEMCFSFWHMGQSVLLVPAPGQAPKRLTSPKRRTSPGSKTPKHERSGSPNPAESG